MTTNKCLTCGAAVAVGASGTWKHLPPWGEHEEPIVVAAGTVPGNPEVVFYEGDTIVNFIDGTLAGYVISVTTETGATTDVYVDESGRNEAGFPTINGRRHLSDDEVLERYQRGEEYASLGGQADVGEAVSIDWQSIVRLEVW